MGLNSAFKGIKDLESCGAWRRVVGRELSGVSEYREVITLQGKAIKSYWSACSWRRRRRNPSKRREFLAQRHSVASHNTWILSTAVRTYNFASSAVDCCGAERTEVVACWSRYFDRNKCNYALPRCAQPPYLIRIKNLSSLVCEPYILRFNASFTLQAEPSLAEPGRASGYLHCKPSRPELKALQLTFLNCEDVKPSACIFINL